MLMREGCQRERLGFWPRKWNLWCGEFTRQWRLCSVLDRHETNRPRTQRCINSAQTARPDEFRILVTPFNNPLHLPAFDCEPRG